MKVLKSSKCEPEAFFVFILKDLGDYKQLTCYSYVVI